jgi:hypothetical protein
MYCLETLPMLSALILLAVVHPGAIMPGKESNIPGRKARKQMFPQSGKVESNSYSTVNGGSDTELGLMPPQGQHHTEYAYGGNGFNSDMARPSSTH